MRLNLAIVLPVLVAQLMLPAAASADVPACAPGTPVAGGFVGLPARLPFGPAVSFTVEPSGENDWVISDQVHVEMIDLGRGEPFFTGDVEHGDGLYLRLNLNDDPVRITARFVQEKAPDAEPPIEQCSASIARDVRGHRRMVLPARCDDGVYRPRAVILACGDAGFRLERLVWRRWNHGTAAGGGIARVNDCVPFCVAGTIRSYRVRVRAYRIRRCHADNDQYRYTRVRVTFRGARPAGVSRSVAWPFPCSLSG